MKKRSPSEIMDAILRSVQSGGSQTRIMYSAYISYGEAKDYLALLQKRGLVEYDSGTQFFRVTDKGTKHMKSHDEKSTAISERRNVLSGELKLKSSLLRD